VVHGTGERIDPVTLAPMGLVLLPDPGGLSTAQVYAELDRLRAEGEAPTPAGLDPGPLKRLAGCSPAQLATRLENDLQLPALWLRPELGARMDALRAAGAHGALVSGSGPTVYGVFDDRAAAEAAAQGLPGALVAEVAA
jgi:4-diphosphocytidyl-2-C-methyl-D-erythritol kinase